MTPQLLMMAPALLSMLNRQQQGGQYGLMQPNGTLFGAPGLLAEAVTGDSSMNGGYPLFGASALPFAYLSSLLRGSQEDEPYQIYSP